MIGVKKQSNKSSFFKYVFNYYLNSAEVYLMQFNSSRLSKVFERYGSISLFSLRFYKYFTNYMKLVAKMKQLTRILEMLESFGLFLKKNKHSVEK